MKLTTDHPRRPHARDPGHRRRRAPHVVLRRRRGRRHRGPPQALHGREPRHQRHPRQRRLPGDPGAAADPAPGRPGPRHRPRHQPQGAGRPLARPHPLPRGPRRLAHQLRRHARLDAPRRLAGHHRLHDPAHAHRRLRQRHPLRAGRRRAPRRQRHLGRLGRTPPRKWPRSSTSPPPSPSTAPATASPAPTSPTAPTTSPQDGKPAPVDEGVRTFVGKLVGWTEEGKMLKEVWVSAAGSTYRAAAEDFINAQIPFYYSGSWQVANLSTKIGDAFDWVATGSPCGPAACSGLQGGAALVAIKYTKNPEEVAKVMEYLASEPVVKEFTERTLFLPAHAGVIANGGLKFVSDDPNVQPALEKFVASLPARRPRRPAPAAVEMGQRLLRRARHPHQPGDGRRALPRRRLHPHGPGHRRPGDAGRPVGRPPASAVRSPTSRPICPSTNRAAPARPGQARFSARRAGAPRLRPPGAPPSPSAGAPGDGPGDCPLDVASSVRRAPMTPAALVTAPLAAAARLLDRPAPRPPAPHRHSAA